MHVICDSRLYQRQILEKKRIKKLAVNNFPKVLKDCTDDDDDDDVS